MIIDSYTVCYGRWFNNWYIIVCEDPMNGGVFDKANIY